MLEKTELFTVYVTKHVLRLGIRKQKAYFSKQWRHLIVPHIPGEQYLAEYYSEGTEWHRTEAQAVEFAIKKRDEAVHHLQQQLDELQKLIF